MNFTRKTTQGFIFEANTFEIIVTNLTIENRIELQWTFKDYGIKYFMFGYIMGKSFEEEVNELFTDRIDDILDWIVEDCKSFIHESQDSEEAIMSEEVMEEIL